MPTSDQVFRSLLEIIDSLSDDWEINVPIERETRLVADLAMKSLDLVVLASGMVKRYGPVPFDELYTRLMDMPPAERDLTIDEFVAFVCERATNGTPVPNGQG